MSEFWKQASVNQSECITSALRQTVKDTAFPAAYAGRSAVVYGGHYAD